jgi:hypothetical protein
MTSTAPLAPQGAAQRWTWRYHVEIVRIPRILGFSTGYRIHPAQERCNALAALGWEFMQAVFVPEGQCLYFRRRVPVQ